jgi:hypothetical protein
LDVAAASVVEAGLVIVVTEVVSVVEGVSDTVETLVVEGGAATPMVLVRVNLLLMHLLVLVAVGGEVSVVGMAQVVLQMDLLVLMAQVGMEVREMISIGDTVVEVGDVSVTVGAATREVVQEAIASR